MNYWNHAAGEPWAMTEPALQVIAAQLESQDETLEAISSKAGEPLDNTFTAEVRDGVAIIPISGPLFRYQNIFTVYFGATSYEIVARDFTSALEKPDVKAIIFDVDSPGGEVNGCGELAKLIYEARGTKPVVAYASGYCASGAYWIASACDEVVVSETSALGSIGVTALYRNKDEETKKAITEIVSSQSPYKRLDPEKENDKSRLQTRIDDLADVFIESVARYRGVDPPLVKKDFGRGDIFIGKHAVSQGLADSIGSLEKLIQYYRTPDPENPAIERGSSLLGVDSSKENLMDPKPPKTQSKPVRSPSEENAAHTVKELDVETLKVDYPKVVEQLTTEVAAHCADEFREEGKQKERERIGAILGSEEAKGRESLAQHLAFSTDMDVDAVVKTLVASPKQEQKEESSIESTTGFDKVMAGIDNPAIAPDGEESSTEESADDIAKRIADFSKGGEI